MAPTKKASAKKAAKSKEAVAEVATPKELRPQSEKCQKIVEDVDDVLDSMDGILKAFVIFLNSTEKNEAGETVTAWHVDDPEHLLRALKKVETKAAKQALVITNMLAALSE